MKTDRASATARVIAASTLLLAAEACPSEPVEAEANRLSLRMLRTNWRDRLLAWSAQSPATRWFWRCVERSTHPGIIRHYARRKRWIEARVLTIAANATRPIQLIVLGAGFDTLALRFAERFESWQVIEVDHPATQAVKRKALRHCMQRLPEFRVVDLTTQVLPASLFAQDRHNIVIAEGLLMYLPESQVVAHLRALASSAIDSDLIFSFMNRWPDGSCGFRPRSRWIETWLQHQREPFLWAIAPELLKPFLRQHGMSLQRIAGTEEMGLVDSGLRGELLAHASLHPKGSPDFPTSRRTASPCG